MLKCDQMCIIWEREKKAANSEVKNTHIFRLPEKTFLKSKKKSSCWS